MQLRRKKADPTKEIGFAELQSRLGDSSLRLVNILPRQAFEESRIPGSEHLALEDIPTQARRVLPNRHQEVVVYCGGAT